MLRRCNCGRKPVWVYMPSDSRGLNPYYCDKCVPRGCSCNHEYVDEDYLSNGEKNLPPEADYPVKWINTKCWTQVDEHGREFPCCEFHEI